MLEYSVFNCVSFIYICYKVQSTKCKSKTLRTAKEGCSSVAGYPWMALLRSSWLSFKSLTLIRSHHLATINLATTPSHPPRRTVMRKRISAGPRPSPPPVLIVLSSSTIRRIIFTLWWQRSWYWWQNGREDDGKHFEGDLVESRDIERIQNKDY